jgi:hypothetical protein
VAKPFDTWTVLPHGRLMTLDENLLTVVGELPLPLGEFPRRMTVVKLQDGRLVVFSAVALDEPEMQALERFGKPAFLVIPSSIHRMDAKIWKDRYPEMKVIAPDGARAKAEKLVPVDATYVDFGDPTVRYVTVPGTAGHEAALIVQTPKGTTLVVNDLIWNVHDRPGVSGWLFRKLHLTGPKPQITNVVRLGTIKDKGAVRAQLNAWARLRGLNRIVVSHGDIVERNPSGVLRSLAQTLAA